MGHFEFNGANDSFEILAINLTICIYIEILHQYRDLYKNFLSPSSEFKSKLWKKKSVQFTWKIFL